MEAGLYHGSKALCETKVTQEVVIFDGKASIDEDLVFPIAVCNIPRNARLCLAIHEVNRSAKATKARASVGSKPVSLNLVSIGQQLVLKNGSLLSYFSYIIYF